MSRFNATAQLISVSTSFDEAGNAVEVETSKDVFVNPYIVGAQTWLAARSAGLHADSIISMRSCDYDGSQRVLYNGETYEVERVSNTGEFVRLTLRNRLNND